jgi:hypothetical protein
MFGCGGKEFLTADGTEAMEGKKKRRQAAALQNGRGSIICVVECALPQLGQWAVVGEWSAIYAVMRMMSSVTVKCA